MDLLIATTNPAKVHAHKQMLAPLSVRVRTMEEFPDVSEYQEVADTLEENALGKARAACRQTGVASIGDDAAFEIDTLDGWPGVHTRRIFGDERRATDEELINEVMRRMTEVPTGSRGCQMRVAVAFVAPDGTELIECGVHRAVVAIQPSDRRVPGFPVRAFFQDPETGIISADRSDGREAGSPAISHRHYAFEKLLPQLRAWIALHE
ncbi:MAG: non-canonical purine NTP pyrophosphatase [Candidatus Uhrbacteria bacterium]